MKVGNAEIDLLPLSQFEGDISIVDSEASLREAMAALKGVSVLGFDTETRPVFTRGVTYLVALLQLSSDDHTWLFRLNRIGLPVEVVNLMEDESVMKVGLAIRDDLRAMGKRRRFRPANCVDLQDIAKQNGVEELSLKKMAALVLGVKVSKRQRLTNWENDYLTKPQQIYAATDSWISLKLYQALTSGVVEHERLELVRKALETGDYSALTWLQNVRTAHN